jgi:hypothetical protein
VWKPVQWLEVADTQAERGAVGGSEFGLQLVLEVLAEEL